MGGVHVLVLSAEPATPGGTDDGRALDPPPAAAPPADGFADDDDDDDGSGPDPSRRLSGRGSLAPAGPRDDTPLLAPATDAAALALAKLAACADVDVDG